MSLKEPTTTEKTFSVGPRWSEQALQIEASLPEDTDPVVLSTISQEPPDTETRVKFFQGIIDGSLDPDKMSQEERQGHESTVRSFNYHGVCWDTKGFMKDIKTALGEKGDGEKALDDAAGEVIQAGFAFCNSYRDIAEQEALSCLATSLKMKPDLLATFVEREFAEDFNTNQAVTALKEHFHTLTNRDVISTAVYNLPVEGTLLEAYLDRDDLLDRWYTAGDSLMHKLSIKTDKRSNESLVDVVDKWNDGTDGTRNSKGS